uniref:ATP synthase F0 subunit 8 n=1 Tax=Eucoleus annulatus TaxID=2831232 RepID=A0A8E8HT93_9BILA|nr:ATP synthase F0 subunit 8 [Eucoleus annulatus]QWC93305.1 ATP synthase F0 subunit 8 [Eucoleus annulatus]
MLYQISPFNYILISLFIVYLIWNIMNFSYKFMLPSTINLYKKGLVK